MKVTAQTYVYRQSQNRQVAQVAGIFYLQTDHTRMRMTTTIIIVIDSNYM